MKSAAIFWQSQTGNTYILVKSAAEELEKNGFKVSLMNIISKEKPSFEADLYVFACPVFDFLPTVTMKNFIGSMPVLKENKKALAIITYTALPANTVYFMRKYLKEKNIELVDFFGAKGSETSIPVGKWLHPLVKKCKLEESSITKVAEFIRKKIEDGFSKRAIKFNPLHLFHWLAVATPDYGLAKMLGKRYFLKGKCTLCGNCYNLCPSHAITREGDEIKCNEKLCVGCCGCFNLCATHAWNLTRFEPKYYRSGQYTKDLLKAIRK